MNAEILKNWLRICARELIAAQDELTELDRVIGDGDHGLNMARGFSKVVEKLDASRTPADVLKNAGMTLLSSVGGASGPLYGTFFIKAAQALTADEFTLRDVAAFVHVGTQGVIARGRADLGDKTMVDVLSPVSEFLTANSAGELASTLQKASEIAATAAENTIPLIAKKGRASYLNERSAGHKDAGAASSAIIFAALAEAVRS